MDKATILFISACLLVFSLFIGGAIFVALRSQNMQLEKAKVEQATKLERTREKMNAIPWYKGGQNKE